MNTLNFLEYFSGIANPGIYLAGASGGVYALITAHIATIIMVNIKPPPNMFVQHRIQISNGTFFTSPTEFPRNGIRYCAAVRVPNLLHHRCRHVGLSSHI